MRTCCFYMVPPLPMGCVCVRLSNVQQICFKQVTWSVVVVFSMLSNSIHNLFWYGEIPFFLLVRLKQLNFPYTSCATPSFWNITHLLPNINFRTYELLFQTSWHLLGFSSYIKHWNTSTFCCHGTKPTKVHKNHILSVFCKFWLKASLWLPKVNPMFIYPNSHELQFLQDSMGCSI